MNATVYRDQLQAAETDAHNRLEHLRGLVPGSLVQHTPLPVGSWLRDQAAGIIAALEAHATDYCPHVQHAPQVLYAAGWAPGRLVCADCTPTLLQPHHDDHQCDQCGRHDPRIKSRVAAFGPILFIYGRCTGCAHPLTGD